METVRFKKSGGPITVAISSGYAQPGSFELYLWETDSTSIILDETGDFLYGGNNSFSLPTPIIKNDGRILNLEAKLMIVPPINSYNVELKILQDTNNIGNIVQSGESSDQFVNVQLFAQLQGED